MAALNGFGLLCLAALASPGAAQSVVLQSNADFDTALTAGVTHQYQVALRAGESAQVTFRQMGVDIVVEIRNPADSVIGTVDSPNGRDGDEPVEIIADRVGRYTLVVRPFNEREPAGRYHVKVNALRNIAATRELIASRGRARDSASTWLGQRGARLESPARPGPEAQALFDEMARKSRVLGLGEATHGSREFNDMRLTLTKSAIERSGYRIVAIEASAVRLERLNAYVNGNSPDSTLQLVEHGWIGRRILRELVIWLRDWNRAHPDDRVSLVGVDSQDFLLILPDARAALMRVYGNPVAPLWDPLERALASADSQSGVFGNSRVPPGVRDSLFHLAHRVSVDGPNIRRLHGDSTYRLLSTALRVVSEFADYNSGRSNPIAHSRDWYMAAGVLRALEESGPDAKALYWAHNAHVAHHDRAPSTNVTGGVLRASLGCGYQALAMTFGEGAFVAQRPNDPENRLEVSSLPVNVAESVDGVASKALGGDALISWGCQDAETVAPSWLRRPHVMHWIGGIWMPGSPPSEGARPFNLLADFDALVYFNTVSAEAIPADRPRILPRR